MAAYTTKLNLKKPAQSDFYNVDDNNDNMDKVDEHAGIVQDHIANNKGNASEFGHVKLSDSLDGTNDASTGIAASEYAIGLLMKIVGGLDAFTWAELGVLTLEQAMSYFSIGDEKTVTLLNDEAITLVLADFGHDTLTSGGLANMTFIVKDCLTFTGARYMNSSNTNNGGWDSSYMRSTVMPEIYAQLPTDLKNVLKYVNKDTTAGGGQSTNITTTSDRLWLPSCIETGAVTSGEGYISEGMQYPIFTDNNSRIRSNSWWSRSPYIDGNAVFYCINLTGNKIYKSASEAYGVIFGLCV